MRNSFQSGRGGGRDSGRSFGGGSRDGGRPSFGGRGGGRDDRGGRSSFGGSRDGGRPEMFDAVCDNCGKDCKVPFRPSGEKPIYCSDCFERVDPKRDDRGGRDSRDDRAPRRDSFSNTTFTPNREERPSSNNNAEIAQLKDQLSSISAKLDKLVRILTPVVSEVPAAEAKVAKSEVKAPVAVVAEKKVQKVVKKAVKKVTKKAAK
jgi:CxxC-x17-CxxC domain-containing protein